MSTENFAEQGGGRRNTVVFRGQQRSYAGFYAAEVKGFYWKIVLEVIFPNLNVSANEIVANESYIALKKIKEIIEDDNLDDSECFMKIEEIICLFEQLGSDGGFRHDF